MTEEMKAKLLEQFNKSGLVLEWVRLTDSSNKERDGYVDVLLSSVNRLFQEHTTEGERIAFNRGMIWAIEIFD